MNLKPARPLASGLKPAPLPPTRLTVSGGPKATPVLSQAPVKPEALPAPVRMAHRSWRLTILRWLGR